jgi:arginine decarboxylase
VAGRADGDEIVRRLRQHQRIHLELADHRRLMALLTLADSDANTDRLIDALARSSTHTGMPITATSPLVPPPGELRLETAISPRDAFLGTTEMVPWRRAAGRISAEMICPYPPGIPIAAPGERLTSAVVDYLEEVVAAGGMVEGASDETLEQLRVAVS